METKKQDCLCNSNGTIVMACSGASDVGHLTDIVARKLRDNGVYTMKCLAVVGAGIEASIEDFKKQQLLIIDGCSEDCGKRTMEKNGIKNYHYLRLSDHGFSKGSSPATEANIHIIYDKAKNMVEQKI